MDNFVIDQLIIQIFILTLDGLGVRGNGAHTLDEHILVDSLAERAKLMAGILLAVG